MNIIKKLLFIVGITFASSSCVKEEIKLDDVQNKPDYETGFSTEVKGNVTDPVRGTNVAGVTVKIYKDYSACNTCLNYQTEEIGSVLTDANGNYSYQFVHKSEPKLFRVFYRTRSMTAAKNYSSDNFQNYLTIGKSTTINFKVIRPVQLNVDIQVLNNTKGLSFYTQSVNSPYDMSHDSSAEIMAQVNGLVTRTTYALPNQQTEITFFYFETVNNTRIIHKKVLQYQATLAPVTQLNYTVDCATF